MKGFPRQKLLPQPGGQRIGQGGLGGVYRPPVLVEQQQIVLASVGPVQQLVKVVPGHGDDQITRIPAIRCGEVGGPLEKGGAVPLAAALHLGKDQPVTLPGGVEHPPVDGHLLIDGEALSGVAPNSLPVIEVKLGAGTAALGGGTCVINYLNFPDNSIGET